MENFGAESGPLDIDKTIANLEPDKTSGGGLFMPGKDRVVFRPPQRKSLLGLDVLAEAKRQESKADGAFRVPRERVVSVVASVDEGEESLSSSLDEVGGNINNGVSSFATRRYRDASTSEICSESGVTQEEKISHTVRSHSSNEPMSSELQLSSRSTGRSRSRSPSHSRDDERRSETRRRERSSFEVREHKDRREQLYSRSSYQHEHGGKHERRRSRHEGSRMTPARSDWDNGRWEWEDTPRRDSHSHTSRRHKPSPSPMLVGASPDARLVSPWLGGHTPHSVEPGASPWDNVSPSPVRIRASGSSVRSSSGRYGERPQQLSFFSEGSRTDSEDGEADKASTKEYNHEITESMRMEMEYNSDRAWYDREEGGNTMFDADGSSIFLGDEASFQKKEAELAKKLVRKDGTKMTLAQSKKLSQLTADNAQWEDRQLLRSGAVRGTEVQTEFDDEENEKLFFLFTIQNPLSLMEELFIPSRQSQ